MAAGPWGVRTGSVDAVIDVEDAYALLRSRDRRFDGRVIVAVVTTRIYCRPSCPATMPKRENVRFFASPAAAQAAGFRACKRCLPDAVPGAPEWNLRADLAGRAMRLIADGVADREGVTGLAVRLGYSERQLHRQLVAELGAGPQALARAQRARTARSLLESTALPVSEVAFAAGFASLRQFNATVREVYGLSPTGLRAAADRRGGPAGPGALLIRLAYRPPFDAAHMFGFLAARAVPGVEEGDADHYRRSLGLPYGSAVVTLRDVPGAGYVSCELRLEDLRDLPAAVQRCRRLLDLDADPEQVASVLGAAPPLAALAAARPGLRVPGHADAEELAMRAVLGRETGIAARDITARLVRRYGRTLPEPVGTVTHTFPVAAAVAGAGLADLAISGTRRPALLELAGRIADGKIRLDPGAERDTAERLLLRVPGLGPRTAAQIRMRGLGDPDVFPPADPGVRRAIARSGFPASPAAARDLARGWRPWRSYAVQHLRAALAGPS